MRRARGAFLILPFVVGVAWPQDAPVEGEPIGVVVTASKHGQKITEAPAAITVITAEDIAASGFQSLPDILRRVPGLDIMQTSPREYNVSARGFNNVLSRRLLVLVDGRSVYINLMGFVMWDGIQLNIDDIERIEIVRGPGTALYGANASSGVVNIITKTPEEVGGTRARLGYGELATLDAGLLHGGSHGRLGWKVSLGYYGADAFENPDRHPESDYQTPGENATEQPRGTFRLQYETPDDALFMMDAGYSSTSGILYTGIGPLDIHQGSDALFARTSYRSGSLYVQGYWSALDGGTRNLASGQDYDFTTHTYDVEAQYDLGLGKRQLLVLGASARLSLIESDLTSGGESHGLAGLYAQDEIKLSDHFTATLALRVDRDELMGTVLAPKAALVFAPSPSHSFRLTAATAYNSPSFVESYLDTSVTPIPESPEFVVRALGNRDLDPERATSYEVGYRTFPRRDLAIDANLFVARLQDYIEFIATEYYSASIPRTFSYVNSGDARLAGAEISAEYYATPRLALFGHYSYADADQGSEVTDVTSRHKAGVTIQYVRERGWSGSLGAFFSSELRFPESTTFYEAETLPATTVVNGAASYRFLEGGRLSLGIRGTNLMDRKHREYIAGDIIERKVLAEVRLRF